MSFRIGNLSAGVARKGAIAAGVLAVAMACFVIAGVLMPGGFEVTRTVEIKAPPNAVFPLLDNLAAWETWTLWGDVESHAEGPAAGVGARRVWDDASLGSGALTITASEPPSTVHYLVEVEGGSIRFEGRFSVEPQAESSLVTWTERIDLGWNPLLGWTASGMEESQGKQLEESLGRLKEQAEAAR